jgi:hypothetical protein
VGELSAGKGTESLLGFFNLLVLDEDLADTWVLASACWAGDFNVENVAVLAALFADIVYNFYRGSQLCSVTREG